VEGGADWQGAGAADTRSRRKNAPTPREGRKTINKPKSTKAASGKQEDKTEEKKIGASSLAPVIEAENSCLLLILNPE
jgi:hypothetical protein